MPLQFYQNYLDNMAETPNEFWRNLNQQTINSGWENTTLLRTIQEEDIPFNFQFHDVECWIDTVTDAIITANKDVDDFKSLMFKDIDHMVSRGRYYIFDDNYWLVYESTNKEDAVSQVKIRRCNNFLKWVSDDGVYHEYPCVVGYTLMSPMAQIGGDIITQNGHVSIIVQGNEITKQIPLNKRFLINGTAYKLYSYNNYMQTSFDMQEVPLIFMELYWDAIQPNDNITINLADDIRKEFKVQIQQEDIAQVVGYTKKLTANCIHDNEIIESKLKWNSNDTNVCTVTEDGVIELVGNVGDTCIISCKVDGNDFSESSINITIIESVTDNKEMIVTPEITKIRLHSTKTFTAQVFNNGEEIEEIVTCTPSGIDSSYYTLVYNEDGTWSVTNNKQSTKDKLVLHFESSSGLVKELEITLGALY